MIVRVPEYKHINESFFDDIEDDLFDAGANADYNLQGIVNTKFEEDTIVPNVKHILDRWNVTDYDIECTGNGVIVNVNSNLYLPNKSLYKFSFNHWYFGTVEGDVYFTGNKLTSWKAFPQIIKGNCYANLNNIKNFKGAPNVEGKMVAAKQNVKTDYPLTQENYNKRFSINVNENSVYVISKDKFGSLKDINEAKGYCVVKLENGEITKCKLNDVNCLDSITNILL